MWKPANPQQPTPNAQNNPKPQPQPQPQPSLTAQKPLETEKKPIMTTPNTPNPTTSAEPTPAAAPRNAVLNTQEQATIGKSLVIKGEVTGSEALYIDGRVEGSINLAGNRVTVGRNGQVSANVQAREIVIIGKVRGNLVATDRVDIRAEGSLTGDVVAQRISIEDGAFFKGGIDIRKPGHEGKPTGKADAVPEQKELAAARA